jgi:hypothetical protein
LAVAIAAQTQMTPILQVYTKVDKFGKIDTDKKQTKSPYVTAPLRRKKYSKNRLGIKRRIPGEIDESAFVKTNFLVKILKFFKILKS